MKIRILIFLLSVLSFNMAFAGSVEWNGQIIQYSDEFSLKTFTDRCPLIPTGTTVYASSFGRETPDTEVFNPAMTRVTFIECSTSNIIIPSGNLIKRVYRSSSHNFKVQNDGEDWIVDGGLNPREPLHKEVFLKLGLSMDPADIPSNPLGEPITITKQKLLDEIADKEKEVAEIQKELDELKK